MEPTQKNFVCIVISLTFRLQSSCTQIVELQARQKCPYNFLPSLFVFGKSFKYINLSVQCKINKTGFQPVSRSVERILGFFQRGHYQRVKKRCKK